MGISEKDKQLILAVLNYIEGINQTHLSFRNDKELFLENRDYQFSIAFALIQIGEIISMLKTDIKDKPKIKNLRNRIVHGYGTINKELLWEISHTDIKTLRNELEQKIGI